MRITNGTTRFVLIGKKYTVKVAKFHALRTVKELVYRARRGESINFVTEPETKKESFRDLFLGGMISNLRERRFSPLLGTLVVPTRFSFLGVFNVQETAASHGLDYMTIWRGLLNYLANLFMRLIMFFSFLIISGSIMAG
jgi:hypothetical protein